MIGITNTDRALFSIALSSDSDAEDHPTLLIISHGVVLGLLFCREYPEYAMQLLKQHEEEVLGRLDSFSRERMKTIFSQICSEFPLENIS